MKKIINPWRNHEGYNCFGCSPDNPIGHSFQMQYKDTIGEPFDWLYIDANTLKEKAAKNGYVVEVVAEGEHYDYLARIAKKIC